MAGSGSNSISGNNTFNNLTLGTSATTSIEVHKPSMEYLPVMELVVLLLRYPGYFSKSSGTVTINYAIANVTATGGYFQCKQLILILAVTAVGQ
ncbi:MAG: hypothetical protein IPL42_09575 [Saprospiraceae bacterium]|nr:hypothetical protein [Saprospiraceae bacterium]